MKPPLCTDRVHADSLNWYLLDLHGHGLFFYFSYFLFCCQAPVFLYLLFIFPCAPVLLLSCVTSFVLLGVPPVWLRALPSWVSPVLTTPPVSRCFPSFLLPVFIKVLQALCCGTSCCVKHIQAVVGCSLLSVLWENHSLCSDSWKPITTCSMHPGFEQTCKAISNSTDPQLRWYLK